MLKAVFAPPLNLWDIKMHCSVKKGSRGRKPGSHKLANDMIIGWPTNLRYLGLKISSLKYRHRVCLENSEERPKDKDEIPKFAGRKIS